MSKCISFLCLILLLPCHSFAQADVMMQAFYWELPVNLHDKNGIWWDNLADKAGELKDSGFTALWTPVPCKGNWGIGDNGYGVYDHYDLGNYDQKGSIETRFGSRSELERMIAVMHREPRMDVYSDVVLNHLYSGDDNAEINPVVKSYVFSEACNERYMPYPANEIKWVIPDAPAGDYYIRIKGYCMPWASAATERGYEMVIKWDESAGRIFRGHIESKSAVDEFKITLPAAHDIEIRLAAKQGTGNDGDWSDAGAVAGLYPCAVRHDGVDYAAEKMLAYTNTAISYPLHTGEGEPNYSWNYSHFHPADVNDRLGDFGSDEIVADAKFFGNDFNTFDTVVQSRLADWGKWLIDQIGFDGFRLDFVTGFQESFVADWVKALPPVRGTQPFVVGEYWGADYRIKNWVTAVASMGADVSGFDFPLKNSLTDMCNKSGCEFDMSCLNHAGLVRNIAGNSLPGRSVVTFLENHDTGKECDKWVIKDFHLGYAYILTHEGRPCVFYPHFFGDTLHDVNDMSKSVTVPPGLKARIRELIKIRKTYLGGGVTVLSEDGNPYPARNCTNLYIARRQGNGMKEGAIVALNNSDTERMSMWVTVNAPGFADWSGKTLVNLLDTSEYVTVQADGRAKIGAPARNYSIWVPRADFEL